MTSLVLPRGLYLARSLWREAASSTASGEGAACRDQRMASFDQSRREQPQPRQAVAAAAPPLARGEGKS